MNGEGARAAQAHPIAALTYLVAPFTGILFLYLEPYNQDEFVRFHARQSIGFGVAVFAIWVVFGVFINIFPFGIGNIFRVLLTIVNLFLALFWLFLMYKAYLGERYRIPELADVIDQVAPPKF